LGQRTVFRVTLASLSTIFATTLIAALVVPVASVAETAITHSAGTADGAGLIAAQNGRVRALVIGVDNYQTPRVAPILQGAVADARDISSVLSAANIPNVTTLLDSQVTRASVMSALETLQRESEPDDLAIITFSGHGSQETALFPDSEEDGKDEFFVLWGFSDKGPGTSERIMDDELFTMFSKLTARGVHVLFLADTCHAGGMTKDASGARRMNVRGLSRVDDPANAGDGAYYIEPGVDQLKPISTRPIDLATENLPNLSFMAAVEAGTVAPEIEIPGVSTRRGAASYAFARALQGAADSKGNGDGITTRGELLAYVRSDVGALTDGVQKPVLQPRNEAALATPLFKYTIAGSQLDTAPVKIAVAGLEAGEINALRREHPDIQFTLGGETSADLRWDARTKLLHHRDGRLIASNLLSSQLSHSADRIRALRKLEKITAAGPLDVSIDPSQKTFRHKDIFEVKVNGVDGKYVIVFNLAGDGKVQFLYPPANADPLSLERQASFKLQALPPFGSDVLVAAALPRRNLAIENALRLLDTGEAGSALRAASVILDVLEAGGNAGFVSYTTAPR